MRITVLGSGTSTGVPMIGCGCPVCLSEDRRDKRTRSSILLALEGGNVLIDTATDLRYQALRNDIRRIDAVLYTHAHADHVHGIDELRSFNFIQKGEIPCYGNPQTLGRIRAMFAYIFRPGSPGGGIPRLSLHEVEEPFDLLGRSFLPIPVFHGELPILGYRLGGMAYVTDCSRIPESSMRLLEGLDILILGALRYRPHNTHFTIAQALEVAERVKPARTLFTHLGHEVGYAAASSGLPDGVELAYDGMTIEIDSRYPLERCE